MISPGFVNVASLLNVLHLCNHITKRKKRMRINLAKADHRHIKYWLIHTELSENVTL